MDVRKMCRCGLGDGSISNMNNFSFITREWLITAKCILNFKQTKFVVKELKFKICSNRVGRSWVKSRYI
jgi:hypothetical protein